MGEHLSRRDFLKGRTPSPKQILPPGFLGNRHEACSTCRKCIDHCPTGIIAVRDGSPVLDFSLGECTLCGECSSQCPHTDILFEEPIRFRHVVAMAPHCLPRRGVDCQACRDVCPQAAIRFRPRMGGPFLPEVDADACTGCGACISVCPVDAVTVHDVKEISYA